MGSISADLSAHHPCIPTPGHPNHFRVPPGAMSDLITPAKPRVTRKKPNPKVGIVSLGCPKALVDSERILTTLRSEGYEISDSYAGAVVVFVFFCGFLF